MPDDVLIFRPQPRRIGFLIGGAAVETDLYNFRDIPCKDAETFFLLDGELQAARKDGRIDLPAMHAILRQQLALVCPRLDAQHLEALVPRQLQDAITASYEVGLNPPNADGAGAASPSPSAVSTTPSPTATAGGPVTSAT